MTDDKPSREEELEAQALAEALEGRDSDGRAPEDALETAAMLRVGPSAQLKPERQAAILERVLEELPQGQAPSRPFLWWRLWAPVGGLSAAALLLVLLMPRSPETQGATPLPRPSVALLGNQAQAATGAAAGVSGLRADMGSYRQELFAAMDKRYSRQP